jgi:hypothetical protein
LREHTAPFAEADRIGAFGDHWLIQLRPRLGLIVRGRRRHCVPVGRFQVVKLAILGSP